MQAEKMTKTLNKLQQVAKQTNTDLQTVIAVFNLIENQKQTQSLLKIMNNLESGNRRK